MSGGLVELLSLESWVPPGAAVLPPEEWARAERFRDESRRRAFLAGRVLLRGMLHRAFPDLEPAAIPLELTAEGKPFCPLPGAPHFNLSHTVHTVGVAVSGRGPVGLDLEDMTRPVKAEALARRWFHPEEQAFCEASGFSPEAFFRIWTRKEALGKAVGLGLRGRWSQLNTLEEARSGRWIFTEAVPRSGLCLCAAGKELLDWGWSGAQTVFPA